MAQVSNKQKNRIVKKFYKLELKGLKSYKKYLDKELDSTCKKDNKKSYRKYLQKEVTRAKKRIAKLEDKIG
ncbi:MAG: hypothetical protein ACI8ZN_001007 [Bacteroidia bacterium]|jgi:hypothetical protein